jgi:hypothetical protein
MGQSERARLRSQSEEPRKSMREVTRIMLLRSFGHNLAEGNRYDSAVATGSLRRRSARLPSALCRWTVSRSQVEETAHERAKGQWPQGIEFSLVLHLERRPAMCVLLGTARGT